MTTDTFTFSITQIPFNEDYQPADGTRITTNFANLARGASRQENLRNTISMINNRFNDLAHWDNPSADRYAVELDIISVEMHIGSSGGGDPFPLIEVLRPTIVDTRTGMATTTAASSAGFLSRATGTVARRRTWQPRRFPGFDWSARTRRTQVMQPAASTQRCLS